jgi:hypothetical protein
MLDAQRNRCNKEKSMHRLTARAYTSHTTPAPGAERAHVIISVEAAYAEHEEAEGNNWRAPLEDRAIDELRFKARSKGETITGYLLEWSETSDKTRADPAEQS